MALFEGAGEVTNLDVADMREQIAERDARLQRRPHRGRSRSPPATGFERLFAELGAHVVPGGETLNPSTYELLAGIHEVAGRGGPRPAQLLQRDHGRRARLRALREAGPGGARRPPSRRACWPWSSSTPRRLGRRERRAARGGARRRSPPAASPPAARDDAQGRFRKGDAVGFADGEIVAWGGAGSTLAATIERLAEGAEIVTVIAGEEAPIPLAEIDTHVPDGVEIETHEGGQPSWWWLLAAQ